MAINPRTTVRVGLLQHMVELQRLTSTVDESGFASEEWVTYARPRCNVEFDDRLMREIFKDDGVDTSSAKVFTFRYFKGLSIKDRVFYRDKAYEIYGFNNLNEQDRYYKVWARCVE